MIKTAVGGAAGVIHQVDSPTTDCQPNDNVEALRVWMLNKKVECRPVWKPMHKQPVYTKVESGEWRVCLTALFARRPTIALHIRGALRRKSSRLVCACPQGRM